MVGMALTFAQLGLLAERRDKAMQALERNVKCVALFDEVPNPLTGTAPTRLARLTAERSKPGSR
jgi:hypothetical protein